MKRVSAALALVIFSLAPLSQAGALPPNTPCGLKRCDGYLVVRIAVLGPQIEPRVHERKRTIKIVRSTGLMAGGLLTATVVDLWGLIISLLGAWDCIEAVEDDVREMNRQHNARLSLAT
jgi:hypothetical protein